MSKELEKIKLEAEIEKIKAETIALSKPFTKPAGWIPLFIAAGSILTVYAQWEHSSLKVKEAVFDKKQELAAMEQELGNKREEQQKINNILINIKLQLTQVESKKSSLEVKAKELKQHHSQKNIAKVKL